jgi:peptidoglycan/xylan/chitin deacetylase (PgdA/CDA1 family)
LRFTLRKPAKRQESVTTQAAPPGWYPDPTVRGSVRYWDGETWSSYTARHDVPAARNTSTTLPEFRAVPESEPEAKSRHHSKGKTDSSLRTTDERGTVFKVLVVAALLVFVGAPSALAVSEFSTTTGAKTPPPRIVFAKSLPAQIPVLLYHGIGTPSLVAGSVGNYNVTLTNFKADMAALAAAGYATVTPAQYVAWLDGVNLHLPVKPVLITFDDAFWSDTFATPILAQYGFHAVMFVVTGYADGLYGSEYAPWKIVYALPGEGWYLQLHAGLCGHSYLPDAPAACLAGLNTAQIGASQYQYYIWNYGQTDAQFEARVEKDIGNGLAELKSHAGSGWQSLLFAAPFGAWSNGDNQWLDSYWDSQFKVIFTQQITASVEAAAKEYHVRYRLELGAGAQSAHYLMSNLENPAFTQAGATGTVGNVPTRGSG